jgi:hypothetical protein
VPILPDWTVQVLQVVMILALAPQISRILPSCANARKENLHGESG